MQLMRTFLVLGVLLLPCDLLRAEVVVVRDSIGPDSTATDGLPGGQAGVSGGLYDNPGLVVNMPHTGTLTDARFVIFAVDENLLPENDLADILGIPMDFKIWSDGVLGGADSFALNPIGNPSIGGHIEREINRLGQSVITVQPFGVTGPPSNPTAHTTFLVTVDLTGFNIDLPAGEYVMNIRRNGLNFVTGLTSGLRLSASTFTGFEDVFMNEVLFAQGISPGWVNSQLGNTFEQYGGYLAIENGDHDGNLVVDGFDFLEWQRGESAKPLSAFDLNAWELNYGENFAASVAAATVPEPSTRLLLILTVIGLTCVSRLRLEATGCLTCSIDSN